MASLATTSGQGALAGPAKLVAVKSILDKLTVDLKEKNLTPQQRDAALEELKVYGRDPRFADPIFTREGIETLAQHAFDSPEDLTSRSAMRCLANALLLRPETRDLFVDLGYDCKACGKLKTDNHDDEFLASRIIFLTTYRKNVDLVSLIDDYNLADSVVRNIARHAEHISNPVADPMVDLALGESLKLLFNVTNFCTGRLSCFDPALPHLVTLLLGREIPAPRPLDPPSGPLINALLNLDLDSKDAPRILYPENQPSAVAERLIHILDISLKTYDDNELEQTVTPLVGVMCKVYDGAPNAVRQLIRQKLLPTEEDRQQVLGRSGSLPSRLLKNSTNPVALEFRSAISNLLFEMSDRDASKFVEYVGYGFASGFLFQNNIPVPPHVAGAQSVGASGGGRPVNPITGQFLDSESFTEMPEMTQEEKEREAERLFVLFERLRQTGVVDIQNPVEQAFREGRFQEINDDDRVEELD